MHLKSSRFIAAVVVIGAVAAGGAAFTASNTIPSSVAGYGTAAVTGGTITSLTYALSADGTDIETATLVFTGDLSADKVKVGFDGYASGVLQDVCGTGIYASTSTTFTCDFSSLGTPVTTAAENSFHAAVTGPSS